jgi:DMSO/TMAO reductase YedYZ molybdopterin-dependent catalytic subunit
VASFRRVNLAVFGLVFAAGASGFVTYGIGSPGGAPAFFVHGGLGLALAVLLGWKRDVVLAGMRRRWPSATSVLALGALGLLILSILTGVAASVGGGRRVWHYELLVLHVAFAIILAPLFVIHFLGRWVPPARGDFSRRALLRAGALLGAGMALRAATDGLARVSRLPGARRRFTGSHLVGAPGDDFPQVSWLFDDPVPVDGDAWRLRLTGLVRAPLELSTADVSSGAVRREAIIDCTGGWFSRQTWEGTPVGDLLERAGPRAGARSVIVRSITGYSRAFPLEEARRLLLATRVGGTTLTHRHGFPARIVAPGRRGFWWVKWVSEIEVSAAPDWLQPPFPLQ